MTFSPVIGQVPPLAKVAAMMLSLSAVISNEQVYKMKEAQLGLLKFTNDKIMLT